jgi:hypothetical protein
MMEEGARRFEWVEPEAKPKPEPKKAKVMKRGRAPGLRRVAIIVDRNDPISASLCQPRVLVVPEVMGAVPEDITDRILIEFAARLWTAQVRDRVRFKALLLNNQAKPYSVGSELATETIVAQVWCTREPGGATYFMDLPNHPPQTIFPYPVFPAPTIVVSGSAWDGNTDSTAAPVPYTLTTTAPNSTDGSWFSAALATPTPGQFETR